MIPTPWSQGRLTTMAVAALLVAGGLFATATATHQPADKMAVSGASFDVMTAPLVDGAVSEVHTLLSGVLRTSSPTDLVIHANAECALWTDVSTQGNGMSEAQASVKLWVELDGVAVPVSSDDTTEPGKVVFCNRVHGMEVMNLDDEDAHFRQYLRTRTANAFDWVTMDVGPGIHTIELKGQLEAQVTGMGDASAGVGKRTLLVEPEKLSNDASI